MIDTYSEEWRLECEARAVLNMPSKEVRRTYLEKVFSHRGYEATEQLKAKMLELHQQKKKASKK